MKEYDFFDGWDLLCAAFGKNPDAPSIKKNGLMAFDEFFVDKNGRQFLQACRNICKNEDKFPSVSTLLRGYNSLTADYPKEEIKGCSKCEEGYLRCQIITYKRIPEYCSFRCDCAAGKVHYNSAIFPKTVEKFTYKGKIFVVLITAREAMDIGIWREVCSIKDWNTDVVEVDEILEDAEIWLNLEQAKEIGLDMGRFMKDAEEEERIMKKMQNKSPDEAREIAMKEMRKLGIIRTRSQQVFGEEKSSDIPLKNSRRVMRQSEGCLLSSRNLEE